MVSQGHHLLSRKRRSAALAAAWGGWGGEESMWIMMRTIWMSSLRPAERRSTRLAKIKGRFLAEWLCVACGG